LQGISVQGHEDCSNFRWTQIRGGKFKAIKAWLRATRNFCPRLGKEIQRKGLGRLTQVEGCVELNSSKAHDADPN
jgi:hypothetical protein